MSDGRIQYAIDGLYGGDWIDHKTHFSELILGDIIEKLSIMN